jgi:leucyl-tRNA synthetase
VTNDIEEYKFNTAISTLMELTNTIIKKGADKETFKSLVLLLAPFAPHLCEEVWVEILKQPFSVHKASWPKYDTKYLKVDQINIVIQINGKVRGLVTVGPDLSEKEITDLAKNDDKIKKWLEGREIKKTVFIPGKVINFVV